MGFKVEYSRGQLVVWKVAIAHQFAQSSLMRRLSADENWVTLNSLNVVLPCGARRQPDQRMEGSETRLQSSQVSQRPDWICEILSPNTKQQEFPGGDKFLEYAALYIPHYWIVDPLNGQIFVYDPVDDSFLQSKIASVSKDKRCVLSPFSIELDLSKLFGYLAK